MAVFSIVAVPLVYLLITSILYPELHTKGDTWKAFFSSMLWAVPFFILLMQFRGNQPELFTLRRIYVHSLLHEHLLMAVFPSVLYLLLIRFQLLFKQDMDPDSISHKAITFFSGFYTLTVLIDVLLYTHFSDYYRLFLLPCLRIGTLIALALGMSKNILAKGWKKYVFPLLGVMSTIIAAVPSMLYRANYSVLSILITVVFLGSSIGAFYFWRKE